MTDCSFLAALFLVHISLPAWVSLEVSESAWKANERWVNQLPSSYSTSLLSDSTLLTTVVSWSEALLTPEGSTDCHRKRRSHGIYHTRSPTLEMSVVSGSPFHGASLLLTKDGAACGAASFHKTAPLLGQSAQEWVRFSLNLQSTICSWIIRGW